MLTVGALAACGDSAPTAPETLTLSIAAGDGQQGLVGWRLRTTLVVRVLDSGGLPSQGVVVEFLPEDGGVVSATRVRTDAFGAARTTWALGPGPAGVRLLRASIQDGATSLALQATAIGVDEADVVVVHGALGPLVGIAVAREGMSGIEMVGAFSTVDTVIPVPPADGPDAAVVVFGSANRPLRATPQWTPGVDTAHVTLEPPVLVDIDFDVRVGPYATRRSIMEQQLADTQSVWDEQGLGLRLGSVTFADNTAPGGEDHRSSSGLCPPFAPQGAIIVTLVSSIDNGTYTGWGCWSGHIFLGLGTDRFPFLLAHELGHTFTLEHTAAGMMQPSPPGREVREGEVYRAHFDVQSSLNHIFASQPQAQLRSCWQSGLCLPEELDLSSQPPVFASGRGGPVAVTTPTTPPVDAVRPLRRRY
jgi:hypothetical protein